MKNVILTSLLTNRIPKEGFYCESVKNLWRRAYNDVLKDAGKIFIRS